MLEQKLYLHPLQTSHVVHRPGEVSAELFLDFRDKVQRSIPQRSNVGCRMRHQLVCLHMEYEHVDLLLLRLHCQAVFENNDAFTFVRQQRLRTKLTNEQHELEIVHLDDASHLAAIAEDETLFVMMESK